MSVSRSPVSLPTKTPKHDRDQAPPRRAFGWLRRSASRHAWVMLLLPALAALILSLAISPLRAAEPGTVVPDADERLSSNCTGCHGPRGRSSDPDRIPSLAGRTEAELLALMNGFLDGTTADATLMPQVLKGYTPQQIERMAAWFSRQRNAR